MRILVLSNFYPPRVIGGYELFCEGVVDHLRTAGHSVTVLTAEGRIASGQDHVRRALTLYIRDGGIAQPHPALRLLRERRDQRALRETGDWDAALVFHMVGLAKSLLTALHERGPVGYVVGDLWPSWDLLTDTWLGRLHPAGPAGTPSSGIPRLRYPSLVARALAPIAKRMGIPVNWPDLFHQGHWWANSEWTMDSLVNRKALPLADPRVIRHGIPLELFPQRRSAPGGRQLLYVGRVTPQKGIEVALEAIRHLPACTLTIVGHPDRDYVQRLQLPQNVQFKPPVPRERLAEIYAAHDCLLFPVTWEEPLGLVPLEAMAVGVPIVATGTGGSSEFLVDGENCLLVAPGAATDLATAADRILEDSDLRGTLVRNGRQTAERNSLSTSATLIEEAVKELADGWKAHP